MPQNNSNNPNNLEIKNDLVPVESPKRADIPANNWNKQSLRKCLNGIGLSDDEIRLRKGGRFILNGWTGEERDLLDLVKKKWKEQVRIHHEANKGDPEKWKNVNTLYSAILKKIIGNIKKIQDIPYVEYDCIICKKPVIKKVISSFQWKSKVCGNKNCKRLFRNHHAHKRRKRFIIPMERFCAWDECKERFFTTDGKQKFCKLECRLKAINVRWRGRKKEKPYKEKLSQMTPEKLAAFKEKERERAVRKREKIEASPEKLFEHREKKRIYTKKWYSKLPPERKAQINKGRKKRFGEEVIAEKKEQWRDKPWMFETWLMEYKKRKQEFNKKQAQAQAQRRKRIELSLCPN